MPAAHAAAGHFAPAPRLLDISFITTQQGADRRAQPFRQADGQAIAVAGDIDQLHALRHHGIKDARAVNVQRQLALAGKLPRLFR